MVAPPLLFCNACGAANQPRAAYCHACGRPLQSSQPTVYNSATGCLLANVLLNHRYRILAPIAQGGMGAVYKAEDSQLGNRRVAVKEMSQSGLSPQEVKDAANAFQQEAILLAGLQHPNLPSIFEHFEENGRWYLVMSFIEGQTLADYLSQAKGGKLPLDETLHIGLQLCDVLSYLHMQHPPIVFRDLKPSNVMRTASGHLYLIDFGIARHFKPGQAKDTKSYGSMGYAPPEQYGRAQTTPRSDIYSLGATLYQLFSGHDPASFPFQFPPLQSLVPAAPTELATLLAQMLELDQDKRPTSMLVVKQKLQDIVTSLVAPPSPVVPTIAATSSHLSAPVASPQPAHATPALTPVPPLASTQLVATPALPKNSVRGYLFPLFTGIPGGILSLLLGNLLFRSLHLGGVLEFWISSLVISTAAGFITGKYVTKHVMGLFTGLVTFVSLILSAVILYRTVLAYVPFSIWALIVPCGLFSWLAAWLATRKHLH